jgi:hypothetical protein
MLKEFWSKEETARAGRMGINGNKTLGVKKGNDELILDNVAPPKGIGPLTDWLTASRSTWLSYGGML